MTLYTYEEAIATAEGVANGTAKSRLARDLCKLKGIAPNNWTAVPGHDRAMPNWRIVILESLLANSLAEALGGVV